MIQEVAADVVLGLAVAIVLASSAGVLIMFIRSGLSENTGESLVALVFLLVAGPYLTHATVRAIRAHEQASERASGPNQEQAP